MRYEQLIKSADYPLQAKYDHYNRLCFGGELPQVPLAFKRLKGAGGLCACKWYKANPPRLVPDSVTITIDQQYLRDEQSIDAILIHEMIHAYFFFRNDFKENHGLGFLTMRKKCMGIVGFPIPITEKIEADAAVEEGAPITKNVVLVRVDKDRGSSFLITNPGFIARKGEELVTWWKTRGSYADTRLIAYEIATPQWSLKATRIRLQRPVNFYGAKFYILSDADEADLIANGKVVFDHRKVA